MIRDIEELYKVMTRRDYKYYGVRVLSEYQSSLDPKPGEVLTPSIEASYKLGIPDYSENSVFLDGCSAMQMPTDPKKLMGLYKDSRQYYQRVDEKRKVVVIAGDSGHPGFDLDEIVISHEGGPAVLIDYVDIDCSYEDFNTHRWIVMVVTRDRENLLETLRAEDDNERREVTA